MPIIHLTPHQSGYAGQLLLKEKPYAFSIGSEEQY